MSATQIILLAIFGAIIIFDFICFLYLKETQGHNKVVEKELKQKRIDDNENFETTLGIQQESVKLQKIATLGTNETTST